MNRHHAPQRGSILDVCRDRNLFRPWFKNDDSWHAWFAFLAALFALPMTPEQLAIYQQCTGRRHPPAVPAREGWLVVGRRGGKSFVLALTAVYIACFGEHARYLAKGERGTVMIIATDRRQARIIFRYVGALLRAVPLLSQMITREASDGFDLENGITIEIHTATFRGTRGYAIAVALLDEVAFWRSENSTDPDYEIINALKPGMAQFPDAMLLCASSPYARRGALWDSYRKHFGKPGSVLVWQAPTAVMNPTIPAAVIAEALDRDPASAAAEYLAQFRTDVEGFVTREVAEACVPVGVFERAPLPAVRYLGFVDPSGGSQDAFTLGIAHRQEDNMFLDCVREVRPPFSPESVIGEFAATLRSYRISRVIGDRYAGEFPREIFRKCGIAYEPSQKSKSDLYVSLLPLLNSRRVELLDHPRLVTQLINLERRVARSGKDSVDHPPGSHDDLINAAAGAVLAAQNSHKKRLRMGVYGYGGGPVTEIDPVTLRPIHAPEHTRVRCVKVRESEVPAVKGYG